MSEVEYKGFIIEAEQDEFCQSPDDWGNNDMFLVYDHRDLCIKRDGFEPEMIFEYINTNNIEEVLKQSPDFVKDDRFDDYYIFPVYAYIHSGIALSLGNNHYPFNCKWDTSMKGFILAMKSMVKESMQHYPDVSSEEELAKRLAEGLVNTWNTYLIGDVWHMRIIDLEGNQIDSCGGFYGKNDLLDEARGVIDAHILSEEKKQLLEVKKAYYKKRIGTYKMFFWLSVISVTLNLYTAFDAYIHYKNTPFAIYLCLSFAWCIYAVYMDSKEGKMKKALKALSLS